MRSDRFDEEDDFGSDSDDDEVKPKPKKPTVELDICCPACQACIHVKAYKQRVSEPVKPEYRVTADVELGTQMTLPGMAEKKPAAAQVEEPVKLCRPTKRAAKKSKSKMAAN